MTCRDCPHWVNNKDGHGLGTWRICKGDTTYMVRIGLCHGLPPPVPEDHQCDYRRQLELPLED